MRLRAQRPVNHYEVAQLRRIGIPSLWLRLDSLKLCVELAPQKGGDVVWFDGVNRGAGQVVIDGCQVPLPFKYNVGGVLALIHTPVIGHAERPMDRAVGAGQLV